MKTSNTFRKNLLLVFSLLLAIACKDDSIQPVPEWGSGVNGFASLQTGSAANFLLGNTTTTIDANLRWISIDNELTVNKIETFITFDESYVDTEGNPRTARHGGTTGKLFRTFEGTEVLANREDLELSISQADIFNLYQANTFDYCGATVSVFNNPIKPTRTISTPFINGDSFRLRWIFYTSDGRKFDAWSPSVCNEFPGSNCSLPFAVVCASSLEGTYTYSTTNLIGGAGAPNSPIAGPITGSVTLTKGASPTSYVISDISFGHFDAVWEDTPPGGSLRLNDACNFVSISGTDKYGDSYSWTITGATATTITINWQNTYGDKATTVLTRAGGIQALTTTPGGRCP
jgi:hypothetical protein